ncbi:MAG: DUF134 domain-containing protein [Deltaproteobacteria bacterium]|nr:DUF134 domain-containing protein [Deltaproteobacteria bacterium]
MPRPKCCRQIGAMPGRSCFQPEGAESGACDEVLLNLDEYEALRLADFEGLYQEQAAARMNISRQTFGRIVEAARRKIADVLVNGKALRIDGGSVSLKSAEPFRCPRCRKTISRDCGKCEEVSCPHCRKRA